MSNDAITATQFSQRSGVDDWRFVLGHLQAVFRTGSFTAGLGLLDAIGRAADAADHHPDVDVRFPTLSVRLRSHDIGGVSERDVDLARQISELAAGLGIAAEPGQGQALEVAIDALDIEAVLPFWQAVLGYVRTGEDSISDPMGQGPDFWFQQMDEPRPQRNRIHLDVSVTHDLAEQRVAQTLAAGGRLVSDRRAPAFWVLADVEGNEACVCTWQARD